MGKSAKRKTAKAKRARKMTAKKKAAAKLASPTSKRKARASKPPAKSAAKPAAKRAKTASASKAKPTKAKSPRPARKPAKAVNPSETLTAVGTRDAERDAAVVTGKVNDLLQGISKLDAQVAGLQSMFAKQAVEAAAAGEAPASDAPAKSDDKKNADPMGDLLKSFFPGGKKGGKPKGWGRSPESILL